jgi:hypothetical protein
MSSPQVLVHILSQIPLLMSPKWLHSRRRHHCCYRLTAWRYIGHGRRHGIIFHSLLHWRVCIFATIYPFAHTNTRFLHFFLGYNMLDSACNRPKISFGWIARYTMLCCTETPSTTKLEITTPRSGSQLRSDPDFWVQRRLTLTVGNIFWVGCRRPKLQTVCISCYERGGGVVV